MAGSIREALSAAYDDLEKAGGERPPGGLVRIQEPTDLPAVDGAGGNDGDGVSADGEQHSEERNLPVRRDDSNTDKSVQRNRSDVSRAQPEDRRVQQRSDGDRTQNRVSQQPQDRRQQQNRSGQNQNQNQNQNGQQRRPWSPSSWSPTARANFEKLPAEVKKEVQRRETEISNLLIESQNARKHHAEFSEIVRPFEALIAGSGVTTLQATKNLMTTAAMLQTGTPGQRAQTVANIIAAYGIDLKILDQILVKALGGNPAGGGGASGQPNGVDHSALLAAIDQRLRPINEFMSGQSRANQDQLRRLDGEAKQSIEEFAGDERYEYFEDLRDDMADLMEIAAKRNKAMTLEEAYDLAARAHPEISKLVAEKQRNEEIARRAGNLDRARRAASSQPSGTPANLVNNNAAPKGRRAALVQAWDDLSAQ